MGRVSRSAFPPGVMRVRDRIEGWRRGRAKRSPMPEDLWVAAAWLARAHGVYPMARALGVDYGALRRRVGELPPEERGVRGASGGFVEVEAGRLLGGLAETVLEFSGADGAKLSVRLGRAGEVDVLGLADAFWRRGR